MFVICTQVKEEINWPVGYRMLFSYLGVNAEGKVDRPTWKAIQQAMNDSSKFVDSLHHVPWKEGLPEDILKGVQSFLAVSNGGDVNDSDLGFAAPGASASTYQSPLGRSSVTTGTAFHFLFVPKTGLRIFYSSLKGHSCGQITILVGEVQRLTAMHCDV